MAYCKQCGAYIPDGQTKCLACGYDEAAQTSSYQSAAQSAYQSSGYQEAARQREAERAEAEARRKARQEEARRWAEDFRRQRAEEEARRREAEAEARTRSTTEDVFRSAGSSGQEKHTVLAALSYLSALFVLPYFLCPGDSFARYHAKQGLILFAASVIMDIVGKILPIGWIFTLARLYLIYKGMMAALSGREEPLPFIGTVIKL